MPKLLSVPTVAETLGLPKSTVYAMAAAGEIPALRIKRTVRIPAEAFESWLQAKICSVTKPHQRDSLREAIATNVALPCR
jgi:excisionase family DNA binding protein